jgi:hypothetical protein
MDSPRDPACVLPDNVSLINQLDAFGSLGLGVRQGRNVRRDGCQKIRES